MTPDDSRMKIMDLNISDECRVALCHSGRVAIFRYFGGASADADINETALCAALENVGIPAIAFQWGTPMDPTLDSDGDEYLIEYGRPILDQYSIWTAAKYEVRCVGDQSNGYWWHADDVDVSVFQDTSTGVSFYAWNGGIDQHDSAEKTDEYLTIDEAIDAAIRLWNEDAD